MAESHQVVLFVLSLWSIIALIYTVIEVSKGDRQLNDGLAELVAVANVSGLITIIYAGIIMINLRRQERLEN